MSEESVTMVAPIVPTESYDRLIDLICNYRFMMNYLSGDLGIAATSGKVPLSYDPTCKNFYQEGE